jgi:cytosine/adenosine deaminase-related metal-dependent hydrolase
MGYRKITADKIFDGNQFLQQHVLVLNHEGRVEALIPADEAGEEVEKFNGILIPGFINAHCHVELSHLKGKVTSGKGLINFLMEVVENRTKYNEGKEEAISAAVAEMQRNGIVGVGDICNTTDAINAKQQSAMQWHSFVEVLNFTDASLKQRMTHFKTVREAHTEAGLNAVLCGHAPYSVTAATWKAINKATEGQVISVHNQETSAENDLFLTGNSDFDRFYDKLSLSLSPFPSIGQSSLQTWLPHFTEGQTILLVHNLFVNEEDIVFAKTHAAKYGLNLVYCLCPNANLYIENRLPPIDFLLQHQCAIVLGTDSYSSNYELSIASEVKTLLEHFPQLTLEKVLQWITSNGAASFDWSALGAFQKGKRPGVVLLQNDFSVEMIL